MTEYNHPSFHSESKKSLIGSDASESSEDEVGIFKMVPEFSEKFKYEPRQHQENIKNERRGHEALLFYEKDPDCR